MKTFKVTLSLFHETSAKDYARVTYRVKAYKSDGAIQKALRQAKHEHGVQVEVYSIEQMP